VRKNQTQERAASQRSGRLDKHPRQYPWHEALAALVDYRKRYGDCRVPDRWPENRRLASWVARMRTAKKHNLLTQAQIRQLDRIGFTWSFDHRHAWEQRFNELEAFKKKHGHCNVPRSYPPNQPLAYWVDSVRQRKKRGKLDESTIRQLDELGFCWSLLHRRFHRRDLDEFVATIRAFKKRHGHCNLVVAQAGADRDLLASLRDVRKSKKQGRLDPRYVRQLEGLGFLWRPKEQHQQEMYSALLAYRKRYGDCRVPSQWPKNRRLAYWVGNMRAAKRQNRLTQAQVQQLDRVGFIWSVDPRQERERLRERRVKELKAFRRRRGHCCVPYNYPLNPRLGRWVSRMRQQKRQGTLAKEWVRLLNGLGFCWDMRTGKKALRKSKDRRTRAKQSRAVLR